MGIFRYWLTGERDETDKESLVINLYNRRRKVDPSCKNAPRGERTPRGLLMRLPECILLEIIEAYTVLMSWGIGHEGTLARIETYRAQYYGAGISRQSYDLAGYLEYRLTMEKTYRPRAANLSESLIRHCIERYRRYRVISPPAAYAFYALDPFETVDIPRTALLAPIDDLEAERHAVGPYKRQCIDHLQSFYMKGDRNWRFFYNTKGARWVYQGYALLRGDAIAAVVVVSETRYNFGAIKETQ